MEADMKLTRFSVFRVAVLFVATFALPALLLAQHTRYKIIDLGTLGGTNSYQTAPGRTVNNRGEIIAFSDTNVADPNAPNCLQSDCLISHAIKWREGAPTDLGALPGVNDSIPTWITANGLIAGISENGETDPQTGFPELRAVLWNEDGTIKDLGTLGGNFSQAFGANSRGQAVGVALNNIPDPFTQVMSPGATQARAFLWRDGSMRDLGTLGSGNDASAQGVNERGQVTGLSFTGSSPNATTGIPTVHPFLWQNGTMIDLGSLGGTVANPGGFLFTTGPAPSINNRGEVVGTSTLEGDQAWHPFLWDGSVLKDLGTLGGANGEAFWLSDSGLVVGRADFSPQSPNHHAFLWKNGVMTDLGVLPPCLNSTADGVNSAGQAVGDTGDCPGGGHPFLSEHGKPMVDLTTLVLPGSDLTLIAAAYINERGEIAGMGMLPNGDKRAVLLVPASAEEIAAADALGGPESSAVAVHTFVKNSENSVSGARNRALNIFRQRERLP
jgi:probable HAF family extracellular repeat protein